MRRMLTAKLNNSTGVLNRFTGVLSRRQVNIESISVDVDRLIDELCNRSSSYSGNTTTIKQSLASFQSHSFNKLQLLSGHDFTQMLAFYFINSTKFSNKSYNQENIESMLRIGFHKAIFQPFTLFSHLTSKSILK